MGGKKKKTKPNLVYFWKWDLCVGAEWENQTEEIQKGWICEAAEFSLQEVPFFIAEKSHCPSCSPQWWADLLPGDHSFLWLSQVVVGLVELQPGFHISKRSPTSPGVFEQLFTGFCLACFAGSHLPWHTFTSVYTSLFFFPHFCLLLLWNFPWQGWLIDRH